MGRHGGWADRTEKSTQTPVDGVDGARASARASRARHRLLAGVLYVNYELSERFQTPPPPPPPIDNVDDIDFAFESESGCFFSHKKFTNFGAPLPLNANNICRWKSSPKLISHLFGCSFGAVFSLIDVRQCVRFCQFLGGGGGSTRIVCTL